MTLDDDIKALAAEGDELVNLGNYVLAIKRFEAALDLLPEPVMRWSAATWLYTAIGEAWFFGENFNQARQALTSAVNGPDGLGNPFIHLRLGQVQYELGHDILAADELARAYMGGGKEIFEREDEKYFNLVRERLIEPPGGW